MDAPELAEPPLAGALVCFAADEPESEDPDPLDPESDDPESDDPDSDEEPPPVLPEELPAPVVTELDDVRESLR